MNKTKLVNFLVELAEEIENDAAEGLVEIPSNAHLPADVEDAFAYGRSYALRDLLGYIAAGDFEP